MKIKSKLKSSHVQFYTSGATFKNRDYAGLEYKDVITPMVPVGYS